VSKQEFALRLWDELKDTKNPQKIADLILGERINGAPLTQEEQEEVIGLIRSIADNKMLGGIAGAAIGSMIGATSLLVHSKLSSREKVDDFLSLINQVEVKIKSSACNPPTNN
jgi:hypothetical protein